MCLARASREKRAWLSGNGVFTISVTVLIRLKHSQARMFDSSIFKSSHMIFIDSSFFYLNEFFNKKKHYDRFMLFYILQV